MQWVSASYSPTAASTSADPARIRHRPAKLSAEGCCILTEINNRKHINQYLKTLVSKKANHPTRRRNRFVNDAAVETDGEGGDIISMPSSPEVVEVPATPRTKPFYFGLSLTSPSQPQSLPSKPPRKAKVPFSIKPALKKTHVKSVSFHIKPSIIHPINTFASSVAYAIDPSSNPLAQVKCDLCSLCLNGPHQLHRHRDSKKCRCRVKENIAK